MGHELTCPGWEARHGLVVVPVGGAHPGDGVACGVGKPHRVAGVVEAVADLSLGREDQAGDAPRSAAAEHDGPPPRRERGRRGKHETLLLGGVAQGPAGQLHGICTAVDQLDEFVLVGVALTVAVGVARRAGRRVGQHLVDRHSRLLGGLRSDQ